MSDQAHIPPSPGKKPTTKLDIQELIKATRALKQEKSEVETTFSELYPYAKEALSAGATRKSLLAAWAEKGLKLHPTKFKELFLAEAKRRGDVTDSEDKE